MTNSTNICPKQQTYIKVKKKKKLRKMSSYEKKNALNKAIDKVLYSNNKLLLTVIGLCGINIVLFQIRYKYVRYDIFTVETLVSNQIHNIQY